MKNARNEWENMNPEDDETPDQLPDGFILIFAAMFILVVISAFSMMLYL